MICPNELSTHGFLPPDFNHGKLNEDSVDIVNLKDVDAQLQKEQIEFFRHSDVLLRSVLSRTAAQALLAS